MSNYKYIIDSLSATASFIAIVTVLWIWFKNSQRPLKIERVVIHKKEQESTYILVIINRKPYPVELKSTNCYTKPYFRVVQKKNQGPEYSALLSLSDNLFLNSEKFVINASGHTDIRISGNNFSGEISKILFSIQSSHGYHQIWCKNILIVDMSGNNEANEMDHVYEFDSKVKAKIRYYWLKCIEMFK